jgi:hypothetical protein
MISAADFPDIFPSMADEKLRPRQQPDADEYDSCLARWEHDGGRVPQRPFDVSSPSPETICATHLERDRLETDALFPLVPTLAIVWTCWLFLGPAHQTAARRTGVHQ